MLSELGRFPLHFDIVKSLVKYWYRFENISTEFNLLKDAYLCSQNLSSNNKPSWYFFVSKLLEYLGIKQEYKNFGPYKFFNISRKLIREKYISDWYKNKDNFVGGKLSTFLKIKQNFGYENYLSLVKNFEIRRAICKLRISAHRLKIETGRYTNIPRNERICNNCSSGCIEDETHFLISCDKYKIDRKILFDFVNRTVQNFSLLNSEQKLVFLLSNEDCQVLNAYGKFVKDNLR